MAGEIRISTEEVNLSASSIEHLNNKLNDKLLEAQAAIKALGQTWEGEAYDRTVASFDAFAGKYFESYKELIDDYVKFLRERVGEGYFKTEVRNADLASDFAKK